MERGECKEPVVVLQGRSLGITKSFQGRPGPNLERLHGHQSSLEEFLLQKLGVKFLIPCWTLEMS